MIGYYIHHHGNGHLARASAVAAATPDEPVVALSSLAEPAAGHPFAGWVRLAPDDPIADPVQPTADGALHWAPLNSHGYRIRMATLTQWAVSERPRLVVVDVSVEVSAALRLAGVPVVVTAMAGERHDNAHTLAYRLASAVVAPWPADVMTPPHLAAFVAKTHYVGAFSRFDDRPATRPAEPGRVLMMFGSGGGGVTAAELELVRGGTGRKIVGIGGSDLPWHSDVWDELCAAEIVVVHGGMNALAEVAAAGRATVVIAQPRPFGEQAATARALAAAGIVTALDGWPETAQWPAVLDDAAARGGAGWKRWNDHGGAARFAAVLAATHAP